MSTRSIAIKVSVLAFALSAGASFLPPPRPPAGWQQNAAKGFEPGIEASLVKLVNDYYPMYDQVMDERVKALWDAWGERAVEPLTALYRDEAWEGFAPLIVRLLAISPFESAHAVLADELRNATDDNKHRYWIAHSLSRYQPELVTRIFEELVQREDAVAKRHGIEGLLGVRTPEALAKAKAVVAALPEGEQAPFQRQIQYVESHLRAQEPMARILAKEKEEDS